MKLLYSLGIVLCIALAATLMGCTALRGSMSEEDMRAVIDQHIHLGDSAAKVREAFIELARPSRPEELALRPMTPQERSTRPDAEFLMPATVDEEFHFPFDVRGARLKFFFDRSQQLLNYEWLRIGASL